MFVFCIICAQKLNFSQNLTLKISSFLIDFAFRTFQMQRYPKFFQRPPHKCENMSGLSGCALKSKDGNVIVLSIYGNISVGKGKPKAIIQYMCVHFHRFCRDWIIEIIKSYPYIFMNFTANTLSVIMTLHQADPQKHVKGCVFEFSYMTKRHTHYLQIDPSLIVGLTRPVLVTLHGITHTHTLKYSTNSHRHSTTHTQGTDLLCKMHLMNGSVSMKAHSVVMLKALCSFVLFQQPSEIRAWQCRLSDPPISSSRYLSFQLSFFLSHLSLSHISLTCVFGFSSSIS